MRYLLVLLLFLYACTSTKGKQERENLRSKPYYKKGEYVYVKPDSLLVKIISSRRSEAGPVYMVTYRYKYGYIREQVMEFEMFK